jgi:hypothetical protein
MERVMAWSGRLLASGISQGESGGISPRLWLSAGANEWRPVSAPDAWLLRDMASIRSGEAFLAGSRHEIEGGVWRSADEDGEWEHSTDPGLAKLQQGYGLEAGATGLVLLGEERRPEPNRPRAGVPALWGSPDGVHWVQTLRLEERSAGWSATIPTKDRWFVYGTTGEGADRRHVVWTATPRCATGAANCPSK